MASMLRILLVLVVPLWSVGDADAGAIYKVAGLGSYQELELTFESGQVVGQARPLRGYRDPTPIGVKGINQADGIVELTFELDSPRTEVFRKSVDKDAITWTSTRDNIFRSGGLGTESFPISR